MKERIFKFAIFISVVAVIAGLVMTLPVLAGKPPKDPPPANHLIVVDKDGHGDFTDPVEAVNSITDASAANPYLVKINPGVYDIGTGSVQMQPFVDIEGSGRNITKITGSNDINLSGVVIGASDAELRDVTIENINAVQIARGIYINNASPSITNVTVIVSGTTNNVGIWSRYSWPVLTNVEVTVSGPSNNTGIYNYYSGTIMNNVVSSVASGSSTASAITSLYTTSPDDAVIMNNVTAVATGTYGKAIDTTGINTVMNNVTATGEWVSLENKDAVAKLNNSVLNGAPIIINNENANSTIYAADTRIDGGTILNYGTLKCISVYDGNHDPLTCP